MAIELESLQLSEKLQERVKELGFLHHAARLLNMRGEARDIVRGVVESLPSAWRYPELAAARISFDGVDIASRDYLPSGVAMRADFELDAGRRGFIEVRYPHADAAAATDSFLPEERALLDSCAELLKSYFERVGGEAIAERLFHAEAATQAARSANHAKDQFMGTVAHELRSSLHVMLGWIQILRQAPPQGETASRGLEILERNVTLQAKLIEDLMDLSRIVSGKLELELKPLDLTELVGFAVDATRPAAEKKQLQLTADLDGIGEVLADQQRLQQVIYNLLGNAVKFTPTGGHVHVTVTKVGKLARVTVKDSGIGIPPDLLPHVFERYRQAETESKGRSGGLGLGLAIARQLVELHHGTIAAASDGPGAGTTFELVLPLRAVTQHAQ